jgi:hypothetical protein
MKLRVIIVLGIVVAAAAAVVLWILNIGSVNHWFAVHTGTVNEPGPYYGFWSGFGSDIAEFGIIGAIGTAAYQLFKKYNCHEPGCWRVGTHPAAGGQFSLCYRHHPDYQGTKPAHDLIVKLHRENAERQATIHAQLEAIRQQLATRSATGAGIDRSVDAEHQSPPAPSAEAEGQP